MMALTLTSFACTPLTDALETHKICDKANSVVSSQLLCENAPKVDMFACSTAHLAGTTVCPAGLSEGCSFAANKVISYGIERAVSYYSDFVAEYKTD